MTMWEGGPGHRGMQAGPLGQTPVYEVSEIAFLLRKLLENEPVLQQIAVRGELSNYKRHVSGHHYFTLKDANSRLRCVFFRSRARLLDFEPEDGQQVIALGSIGMYEAGGDVQLYVDQLIPEGAGALHLAFERMKARLAEEGLFDQGRKRPLPPFPKRIGVITSPTGAAIRDIISVARRRHPGVDLLIIPTQVQGEGAAQMIAEAIEAAGRIDDLDLLIVGRGGGSLEELWAFNEEVVARAVANSVHPVISAVGHETDVTIIDFVADLRAPTPSAAAEMAVPDRAALQEGVRSLGARLVSAAHRMAARRRERLVWLRKSRGLARPAEMLRQSQQRLDELVHRMHAWGRTDSERRRRRLETLSGKLDSLSPLATLARGYAICRLPDGRVLRRLGDVEVGGALRVRLVDGELHCRIDEKHALELQTRSQMKTQIAEPENAEPQNGGVAADER